MKKCKICNKSIYSDLEIISSDAVEIATLGNVKSKTNKSCSICNKIFHRDCIQKELGNVPFKYVCADCLAWEQKLLFVKRNKEIEMAKNFEKAERWEDASTIYDSLEMWDDAGRCRRKNKENVTKHIHINANDLYNKIKREGLAIPYKCPNCSGTLKIDGKKKFSTCPYCDSNLDLETLNNLVKALM